MCDVCGVYDIIVVLEVCNTGKMYGACACVRVYVCVFAHMCVCVCVMCVVCDAFIVWCV